MTNVLTVQDVEVRGAPGEPDKPLVITAAEPEALDDPRSPAESRVRAEVRRALVDIIRRDEPSTVLGLLITRAKPLTVEAVAGLLGKPVEEVEDVTELLEAEELCGRVQQDDGLTKVFAFAPYTERNQ